MSRDNVGIEAQLNGVRNFDGRGARAEGSKGTSLADNKLVAELALSVSEGRLGRFDIMVDAEVGHKVVNWVKRDVIVIAEGTGGDVVASVGEQRLPSQGDGGSSRDEGSKSHHYN